MCVCMYNYLYCIYTWFYQFITFQSTPMCPKAIVLSHRFSSQCLRFLTWARQQEAMDGSTLLLALIYETASQPGKIRRFKMRG